MLAASKIPRDDSVPHLARVADEAAMCARFAAYVVPGWTLRRCRIKEARYYPGLTCLFTYYLKFADDQGGEATLTLHARAFGAEAAPAAFRDRTPIATPMGVLPSFLADENLALWTFPDDPGVHGLGDVWRAGGALFDTPGALVHAPWDGARPGLEVALVSYVPAKRCILRYDRLDHARPESFYGKVYAQEDAALLYAQMEALWSYARTRAPELHVARPLGFDAGRNALWQSSPGGDALLEVLDGRDLPRLMRRVAAALAAIHRSGLEPARRWRVADETHKLERTRAALQRFHPGLAPRIDAVLGRLVARAPAEPARLAPVHGDFHCNQVLVQDDRVAVIDFDLFAAGDPLLDVGRFLSRFRAHAHGKLREADVVEAQRAFVSAYEILVPWRVDRRRLAWATAALLVNRQALKSVKKLSSGGPEPVAELLDAAAQLAEGRDLE